jgi:HlyD family secretion protein
MKQIIYIKSLFSLILLFGLIGCDSRKEQVLTHQVNLQNVDWEIYAEGELEATTATPINGPSGRGSAKTISWLAPNNSRVAKGELLIKFDPYDYKEEQAKYNYNLDKIDAEGVIKDGEVTLSNDQIGKGLKEVSYQRQKNESIDWENSTQTVPRIEIIDKMANLDFLNTKERFYHWKDDKNQIQNKASQDIIELEKQSYQDKLKRAEDALKSMSVEAPHDGIFVYQKSWSGDEPYPGMKVWPGMRLGQLPDLSRLQAKIWVREQDAIGLKPDLLVDMVLDAYPAKTYQGKILKVDQYAKKRDNKNPVKYVELEVSIEGLNPKQVLPGYKLTAAIIAHQITQGISIPTQAIFSQGERQYVYKQTNDGFEKTSIQTGFRNLTLAEITNGIRPGDVIALHEPKEQ